MTKVYLDWINSLREPKVRARIQVRVDRLVHGNPGQSRYLSEGVSELKIDLGPGYRVYYTERNGQLIILLAGGDKERFTNKLLNLPGLTGNKYAPTY